MTNDTSYVLTLVNKSNHQALNNARGFKQWLNVLLKISGLGIQTMTKRTSNTHFVTLKDLNRRYVLLGIYCLSFDDFYNLIKSLNYLSKYLIIYQTV